VAGGSAATRDSYFHLQDSSCQQTSLLINVHIIVPGIIHSQHSRGFSLRGQFLISIPSLTEAWSPMTSVVPLASIPLPRLAIDIN